jgi:hypothetical protein
MEEQNHREHRGFFDAFKDNEKTYLVNIKHYFILTREEREQYSVEDGQFLVHLFSNEACRSFKLFLDEELNWSTDAGELMIDRESVEIIGSIIDERSALNKWD